MYIYVFHMHVCGETAHTKLWPKVHKTQNQVWWYCLGALNGTLQSVCERNPSQNMQIMGMRKLDERHSIYQYIKVGKNGIEDRHHDSYSAAVFVLQQKLTGWAWVCVGRLSRTISSPLFSCSRLLHHVLHTSPIRDGLVHCWHMYVCIYVWERIRPVSYRSINILR